MPARISRVLARFSVLRKWLRTRTWLDDLLRIRELFQHTPERPRWWPTLILEELEPKWVPTPIQFFYIPMPEASVRTAFSQIVTSGTAPGNVMTSFVNIAATENGTILTYDQWEDGYETNIDNPIQSTTQIWGDGNPANGAWPGAPAGTDPAITAGQVIQLRNDVPANPRVPANIFFDGGDKVGANKTVSISRAQFPVTPGSVIASAVEVRDTRFYDTTYTAPVGTNTANAGSMFTYVSFFVMASQDNTTVQIDRDRDGIFEQTVVLNQGQTVVSANNVLQGGRVIANKPVQTQLLTGHIGGQYASRSYTLFPDSQLTNNYFTAVGQVNATYPVAIYIYNPNPTPLNVSIENRNGTTALTPIPAFSSIRHTVPFGPGNSITGTRVFTPGGETFAAVGTADATSTTYDWGFSLQPVSSLSQLALVALGAGNSNNPPSGAANTSPIWVTVLANTTLYVDYDGNPATGANVDPFGNRYDIAYSLSRLQTQLVRDTSDNDNSGMRLYTTDGTLISTSWGEDASTAPTGAPGFDAGTTVPAVPVPEFYKFATFAPGGDLNGDGYYNSGDIVRYSLRIRHIGTTPISNVLITDALPPEVTYVGSTTFVDFGSGLVPITDSGTTAFPLDEAGFNIANLSAGSTTTIYFDVTINSGLPVGTTEMTNRSLLAFDIFRLPAINTLQLRTAIGDRIWHDLNGNGAQDAGEPGIPNVGLTLTWFGPNGVLGGGDDVTYTRTTDANGIYRFTDLPSGNFSLSVNTATLPANVIPTYDLDGIGTANTVLLTQAAAQARTDADFGYRGNSTIGDLVWYDVNGNGLRETGIVTEPVIPGALVTLTFAGRDGLLATTADNITYTATTNASGLYSFSNLFGGDINGANPNYRVVVTPPAAYTAQTYDATAPTTDNTSTLQLANSGTNLLQDFGYRGTATLGNFVWLDSNGNGIQDGGEPGIDGITVQLRDSGGTVIAQTTTAGGGLYSFPGLIAGTYSLVFGNTDGTITYVRTAVDVGANDAIDSDGAPATGLTGNYTLTTGQTNLTVDQGLYRLASFGDRVWFDVNGNGAQDGGEPGISGVTVRLDYAGLDGVFGTADDQSNVATQVTGANGIYLFINLVPGTYRARVDTATLPVGFNAPTFDLDGTGTANQATFTLVSNQARVDVDFGYRGTGSIGDRVWHDTNANGSQDAGEPGIPGVGLTVTWLGFDGVTGGGDDLSYSATTDSAGIYTVSNLPGGNFTISMNTATLPLNSIPTFDLDGIATANTTARSLAAGETATNVDFGYRGNGTIGDRVWFDVDGDGVQDNVLGDGFEPGLVGVTVTLTFAGRDGDLGTTADNVTYTTVTGANGLYSFSNLFGGDISGANPNYRVVVTPPSGYTVSSFDADGTGTLNQSSLQLGNEGTNLLQDFGYRGPANQGVSDFVWLDSNGNGRQDAGEPGLSGVVVELWAAGVDGVFNTGDDVQLDVTSTNGSGLYSFVNLPVSTVFGSYQVRFVAPAGHLFTVSGSSVATSTTDSNANALGRTGALSVLSGVVDSSIDAGVYVPVVLGDRVYVDQNGDGVQQGGEPGVVGASVVATWLGVDGVVSGDDQTFTVLTGANGAWSLGSLPPGNYLVQVTPPAGFGLLTTDSIDNGVLNASNPVSLTLVSGTSRSDVDFGFGGAGAVGDRIYHDVNGDGVQQAGEPGLADVGVTLTWAGVDGVFGTADDAVYTTVTGANGVYSFGSLPAGSYRAVVNAATLPAFAVSTDSLDDGVLTPGSTVTFTLAAGQVRNDVDFGYTGNGTIGDLVWYDVNGNGLRETGVVTEPGVGGATITLTFAGRDGDLATTADNLTYTTVTAADGSYSFSNLFGGDINGANPNYRVVVTPPAGFIVQTYDATAPTTDSTSTLQLANGGTNLAQDFGYRGTSSFGNFVWLDSNGNGVQDVGEPGIDGILVELRDAGGTVIAQTTTAGGGLYSFPGLVAGTYSLRFGNSNGTTTYSRTSANAGGNPALDSDANPATGLTGSFTLIAGQANTDVDAGLIEAVAIGDRLWFDLNANGVQDGGEPGINGVTVTLDYAGLDGVFGTLDDQADVASQTTTGDGNYSFTGLVPGRYRVRVISATLPAGLTVPTFDLDGTGSANQAELTLASGVTNNLADFGYRGVGSVGTRVWLDSNGNGLEDSVALEPGLPGVTIGLTWAGRDGTFGTADDMLIGTTITDGSGLYSFANLPAGAFRADVVPGSLPSNVTPTFDLNGPLDNSAIRMLAIGESATDVNFGYVGGASIGDRVWYDVDGDGTQNNAEPGISGATVTLVWAGPDGDINTAADNVTYTTTTDANGNYLFSGLPVNGLASSYRVSVVPPSGFAVPTFDADGVGSPSQSTLLLGAGENNVLQDFGYRGLATQGIGSFVWEDLNGNGRQDAGEPGIDGVTVELYDAAGTALYAVATTAGGGLYAFPNLLPGTYQVRFAASDGVTTFTRTGANIGADDTIDSDANVVNGFSGPVLVAPGAFNADVDAGLYVPVSFGDRVWLDADGDGVQDSGEPGVSGVLVTATWFGPDGVSGGGDDQAFSVTTGVDGVWSLSNLPPGNYSLVAVPPAGLGLTVLTDSVDDGVLSAVSPVLVTQVSGGSRSDVDFGYRGSGSIGDRLWHDVNGDGVQDAGEPGLPGVGVTLTWAGADGVLGTSDDAVYSAVTDASGSYTLSDLPAGLFRVSLVGSTLPLNGVATFDFDGLGTPGVAEVVLGSGESTVLLDFGYTGNGVIGDRVWYDVDGDGVQDSVLGDGFEPGIVGATVTLTFGGVDGDLGTAADNVTYTTVTGADGLYSFSNLFGGDFSGANPNYRVVVTAPSGYGVSTYDSTSPLTDGVSTVRLGSGESNALQDFGLRGLASQGIGDFVWEDLNGNGVQDGGEGGLAGVVVELWSSGGVQLDTTVTDGLGGYSFAGLVASGVFGTYEIRVVAPSGFVFTVPGSALGTPSTDSDVNGSGVSGAISVLADTFNSDVDAGLYVPISLGQRVWFDTNANGVDDPGEPGIPNATITATWAGPNGNVDYTATTDANGNWTLSNLPPGSYTVAVTNTPADLVPTYDLDGTATPGVTLLSTTSGGDRNDVNFGYTGIGSIGDRIFLDANGNGVWDTGEGLDGVVVIATGDLNGDGIPEIRTTTTSSDGLYTFANLRTSAGGVPYTIAVIPGTLPQAGNGTPIVNSVDPDGGGDNSAIITLLTSTPTVDTADFGYRGPGAIGDSIFLDANGNGTFDPGEGITGVLITLTADADGDGTPETFTRTTDANGQFLFDGLPVQTPGGALISYTLTVDTSTLPSGVLNTADPDGGGDSVSTLTLDPANPISLDQDFGYQGPGTIGDRIFLDFNGNGVFDPGEGLSGITVSLTADLNGDGVSETLIATTDADGFYQFGGLPVFTADGSTPVSYTAVVTGFPADVANVLDPDGGNDNQWAGTLEANPSRTDIDFGYRGTGSIGDRVWIDADGDGVQGPLNLEPGLPGLTFTLTWAGPNGVFGDADDTTTSVSGSNSGTYLFANLPSGAFRVAVDAASIPGNMTPTFDVDGVGTPASATIMLAAAETRTDVDFGFAGSASIGNRVWFDRNADGVQDPFEPGIPGATVQLVWSGPDGDLSTTADNVTFTTQTDSNGNYLFPGLPVVGAVQNYTVTVTALPLAGLVPTFDLDSGLVAPDQTTLVVLDTAAPARTDANFGYTGSGSLSGSTFRDDNNDGIPNGSEPGLPGVVITLTGVDPFGNAIVDSITGLPYSTTTDSNGNYTFTGLVPGVYELTEAQPPAYADGLDSAGTLGGNPGNDVIAGINVGPAQSGTGYNFGERGSTISGTVFLDSNRDGTQQSGESGIPGVTIELRDPLTNNLIATTTTDGSGNYSFPNLPAGDYRIVELQPADYGNSPIGPGTSVDVTLTPAGLPGQNFGETLGQISGTVYIDSNGNGLQDAGEPGLSGVSITLIGTLPGGVFSIPGTTDANGNFVFDNLVPATYSLEESQPAGYGQGTNAVGTLGGTLGPATDTISDIDLPAGAVGTGYTFGELVPPGAFIAGSVFLDVDGNGIPGGSGETGIGSVTIELLNTAGTVIATTTTAPDGSYIFTSILPGDYTVRETQPAGYGSSTPDLVNLNVPASGISGVNFGETLSGLSGSVYFDANRDGTRQAGEPGLPGVLITLTGTDAAGNSVTSTAITDASGNYNFTGLAAGTYILTETQPAGYTDGSDSVGTAGGLLVAPDSITSIPIGAGASASGYSFGEVGVAVTGTVFRDDNKNGSLDPGEPGLPGITIQLLDSSGTVIATTTTGPDGTYSFPNVPPGDYTLVEVQPAGYGDVPSGPFAPNSRPITVGSTPVENQNFADALSSISGSVFIDADGNGIRDAGESGLGSITLRLDSAGPDNVFGTADDIFGFQTLNTGADGNYTFTLLPTGVYRIVEVAQPSPFLDGAETAGSAGGDISVNDQIGNIPLAAGTDISGYTFAELPPAGPPDTTFISGTVYLDTNGNGVQDPGEPGVPNVMVSTFSGGTIPPSFTLTDANGNYVLTGIQPGFTYTVTEGQPPEYVSGPENASNSVDVLIPATGVAGLNFGETPGVISGTAYFDRDASGTFNAGDPPLPGVTITLQDGSGATIATVVTGADGSYQFLNLPAGNYRIIESQPAGYNQGTNTAGSGGTLNGTDRIDVNLVAGAVSSGNAFGELGAAIAGTVWIDSNANGVRDPGETAGVGNVTITLLDSSGTVVGTATSNPDGSYNFPNLPPGNYTLVQTQPAAFGSSTTNSIPLNVTPAGVANADFGETLASLSGTVFADTNGDGIRDAGETGISGVTVTLTGTDVDGNPVSRTTTTDANGNYVFTALPAGTYTLTETQPTAYGDGSDSVGSAGGALAPTDSIIRIPVGAGTNSTSYTFAEATSSISGYVYRDFNLDSTRTIGGANPDTGIAGVVITLVGTDTDGRPVSLTTVTDANGLYTFSGLGGGDYTIIETQPPLPTTLFNGFYDGADSPGSLGGSNAVKNQLTFTLTTGLNAVEYNFGELPPADPFGFVYVDLNRDGVRQAAEPGIPNVAITISGTAFAGTAFARPLVASDIPGGSLTIFTDATGRFEYSPIPPGLYTLTETQPAGFVDGLEQDGDPNGPPATVGNDVISNIVLAPFPIRGPFNFGEIRQPITGAPVPPIEFPPIEDPSKRGFLASTPDSTAPVLPSAPNFAAFNPGVRPAAFAAVADESGGLIRVFDFAAGVERFRFSPFPGYTGGIRVATADVTGDGIPDLIVVPGVGGGPVVKVFDGDSGTLVRSWMAFEESFRGGLRVSAADLNGDFVADIIVTPDAGGGPIVRAFDGATGAVLANFFALDETFRGGLRIATADVNNDGTEDLLVTAGEGGGPRVAVYDGAALTTTQARLAGDFFAFAPELRSGFWISGADVDGDGFDDLVLGAGTGGAPRVVVYSGQILATGGGAVPIASFFGGDPASRNGARVLAADLNGDGRAEVLTLTGPQSYTITSIYDPLTGTLLDSFYLRRS